jgi:hypothetical protein
LESISHDGGEGETRVSLVLGDAFLYCGQREKSKYWYGRARVAATKLGDQATIGAITYNRAALNIQNLRLKNIIEKVSTDEILDANAELQTAINYQNLARLQSLDHLLFSADAALDMVRQEYKSASNKIQKLLDSETVPQNSGVYHILVADSIYCHASDGEYEATKSALLCVNDSEIESLEDDDKIIIYSSLSRVFQIIEDHSGALKYAALKERAMRNHTITVDNLAGLLVEFSDV